jgi:guanine nucleotide-binding protein subunit alpha
VVYFNVIKAVRMILDGLDTDETSSLHPDSTSEPSSVIHIGPPISTGDLRTRLLPLIAIEDTLAANLNGGVSIAGGRNGVYVRSGWQALVTPTRAYELPDLRKPYFDPRAAAMTSVTDLAARTLASLLEEVEDLWQHPAVRRLLKLRQLRLDEAAPLCVMPMLCIITITIFPPVSWIIFAASLNLITCRPRVNGLIFRYTVALD